MTSDSDATPEVTGTLADDEIIRLARAGSLITEEFVEGNVQQACYELRAGRVFYEPTEGNRRQTVQAADDILIKPKQLLVVITMESLDLPADMLGRVLSKGKLFSVGLMPVHTYADPGFSGRLGIVLFNVSNNYLRLRPGEPIAKIEFSRLATPVRRPYRGQHGYQSQIWPLAEHMIMSDEEVARDPRIDDAVSELSRAFGEGMGSVIHRVFRFEVFLILSAMAYLLFSLVLIALTQPAGKRLSAVAAIALGVAANAVTSLLVFAATRLGRRRAAARPSSGSGT